MSIAQSAFTVNFPYLIDLQAKHIAWVVATARERGVKRLEASVEAERAWVDAVLAKASSTLEFAQNCTPGCYNNEGQPSERSRQDGFYMGAPTEFAELLETWRREGSRARRSLDRHAREQAMPQIAFDERRYKWREVTGDPNGAIKVRHDYTILGYDVAAGVLDMVVRWRGDGGHCPIHRHVATTTILVLAGEQHLWDLLPDGSRGAHRVRRAGDYALSTGDAHAHLECGGPEGGLVFFGNHARDGVLYEIRDERGALIVNTTIELLVADWKANAV